MAEAATMQPPQRPELELEPLRGTLWAAAPWILGASLTATTSFLYLVTRRTSPDTFAAPGFFGAWLFALLALAALALSALWLLRWFWRAGRHFGAGIPLVRIFEIAAEPASGRSVDGARVAEPSRRVALLLAAALVPPVLLLYAGLLGIARAVGPAGLWFVVLAPAALAVFWASAGDGAAALSEGPTVAPPRFPGAHAGGTVETLLRAGATLLVISVFGAVLLGGGLLLLDRRIQALRDSGAAATFDIVTLRHAQAELGRAHRLPPDPGVSAAQAGEALWALLHVGLSAPGRLGLTRALSGGYPDPWPTSAAAEQLGIEPRDWAIRLADVARSGFTPTQAAALQRLAAHPANGAYAVVARARAADLVAARFQLPFGSDVRPFELSIPPFEALHAGTYAHVGRAGLELANGNPEAAVTTLREIISVGLLLLDESTSQAETLAGATTTRIGLNALEDLYRATGRTELAGRLAVGRTALEDAIGLFQPVDGVTAASPDRLAAARSDIVRASAVARGIRWEAVSQSALDECLGLRALLFGGSDEWDYWRSQARGWLVRRPSDDELFRVLSGERCSPFAFL